MTGLGVIIVARMASARLPGKVLRELAGRPLLDHVIERARRVSAAGTLVVATSAEPADDLIAEHCGRHGVAVHRGPHEDVAGRVLACAEACGLDLFARVNADSPFVDPALIDEALERARREGLEFVTNLHPRTYPYGVAVEVFRTAAFRAAYGRMADPADREHVSRYFYRHMHELRCAALRLAGGDHHALRLTVDTPDDLRRLGGLIERAGGDATRLTVREVIDLCAGEAVPS